MSTFCCEHARRAQWRPIGDFYEELQPVVVIDIRDPGNVAVAWNDDITEDSDWTHFAELPQLTNEQAEDLEEEMRNANSGDSRHPQ